MLSEACDIAHSYLASCVVVGGNQGRDGGYHDGADEANTMFAGIQEGWGVADADILLESPQ